MKYIFVLIFLLVFICSGKELGYTEASPIWTHSTYMFQHAGIIHLIINSLAFIGMFRVLEKYINHWILALLIFSIGFIVSFFCVYDIPTVGCSSCVYAMVGMYIALVASGKIVFRERKKFILFIASVAICLIVSFLKSNSNFSLHIISLLTGLLIMLMCEYEI